MGGQSWSLRCDILWFHGAVAGMLETVCCGTTVSAECTACWWLVCWRLFAVARWWVQNALHAGDWYVGDCLLWHDGDCRMHCMLVTADCAALQWCVCGTLMVAECMAWWWLQSPLHCGDCKVDCIVVIVKFMAWWWLQISLHSCDCKVLCIVVLNEFMAWWWLQSSLHSKCVTCWWLQGVLCVGDCKTFDKLVIAKCVTYWWFQNVWPTRLCKSLCKRQLKEFGISG